jgi:hypothetical protein
MARHEDGGARAAAQEGAARQGARAAKGLNDGRKIRFSKEEWDAAAACGEADYGGMRPSSVVRTALRLFLKKRGYLG